MLKYKKEVDLVCEMGIKCPPDDIYPMEGKMYRFLHIEDCVDFKNNNLPNKSVNPHREIKDDGLKCVAYASLSCFDTIAGAVKRYSEYLESSKRFYKTAGCYLGEYTISIEDGFRTKSTQEYTHFSFFEEEGCNLNDINKCNTIIKLTDKCGK